MRRRHSFAIVLVGNRSLLRGYVGRILRSANFRILASVSCADDFLSSKVQPHDPLFFIVHTGDDFDVVTEQIELLRRCNRAGELRSLSIAIGKKKWLQHFGRAPMAFSSRS